MTVAALRADLEGEEVLWGLSMMRKAHRWERWEMAEELVRKHLPPGVLVRMPLKLMPDWYRKLWWDLTQLDGRAELHDINQVLVRLNAVRPGQAELDTTYSVNTIEFLDAVLNGEIGDAS